MKDEEARRRLDVLEERVGRPDAPGEIEIVENGLFPYLNQPLIPIGMFKILNDITIRLESLERALGFKWFEARTDKVAAHHMDITKESRRKKRDK